MNIEYDHSKLYMHNLHKIGIRSTIELEEVIEWRSSSCLENKEFFDFPIFIITGLTKACKGVSVAVMVNDLGKFVTLDARIPSRDELLVLLSS